MSIKSKMMGTTLMSLLAVVYDGRREALTFEIVAEGVERNEQLAFLRDNGCAIIQGYHFSRPLPPTDVPAFVAEFEGQEKERVAAC